MTTRSFEPIRMLGCEPGRAQQLLRGRRVTPGEVEALAMRHYPWRRHAHDPDSYWVTVGQAAEILALSPAGVRRLLDRHSLAHVRHETGVRLMRRADVEALAVRRPAAAVTRSRRSHPAPAGDLLRRR